MGVPRLKNLLYFIGICLVLQTLLTVSHAQTGQFDLLIKGGMVMDGTGNPWFYADIGIRDGRIVAVGKLEDSVTAARTIDATGLTVTPGFIDLHTHAFDNMRPGSGSGQIPNEQKLRAAPNLVAQGITTLITNQDGRGGWPIIDQKNLLESGGVGPNTLLLIGHGVVRRLAMGNDFRRIATAEEIEKMKEFVRQGMAEGAYGISAGLEYTPGRWSNTEEVAGIVGEIVPFGGVFIEHERGSGEDPMWYLPSQDSPGQPGILQSVSESIEIAEQTGATVVATHLKAKGARFWGSGRAVVNLIENARARGVNIWGDSYPYNTTGSDGSTTLIPGWLGRGNAKELLAAALADPRTAKNVRQDIAHEINRRGGAQNLIIMEYTDQSYVGKNLSELADMRGVSDVEMAIILQQEGSNRRGGARIRGFSLSEIDVEIFAAQKWVATASDAGVSLPGSGSVHARFYGTFPRKIRHYAINRGVLSVEDAIRSMTSLPAQILGFKDRGLIRENMIADITIIDLKTIRDKATFFEPHQYPEGIEYVIVNGVFVVDNGELTWALPGKLISPPRN